MVIVIILCACVCVIPDTTRFTTDELSMDGMVCEMSELQRFCC